MKGWDERPLRAYSEIRLGRQRSPENSEGPHMIRYLRAANVQDGTLDLTDVKVMNFTPEEQAVFSLRSGDVLVTEGSGSLSSVGASAVWREELSGVVCFQNTLIRLRPRSDRTDGRFLGWWARHAFADGLFAAIATGANIHHVSAERVRDLRMRFPQLDIQRAIADFLDVETARIDALVAKKRRMSELAFEQLGARIEQLLTDSDVEFALLRRLLTRPPQYGASETGAPIGDGWPRYIRITDLNLDGTLRSGDVRFLAPEIAESYLLDDGDILVARSGATVGKAFMYKNTMGPSAFAGYLIRLVFDPETLLPGLVEHWTQTNHYWSQIGGSLVQATIQNVSAEKYKDLLVPVPDRERQADILELLDRHRGRVHDVTEALKRQIGLLSEHRQALITAAVTGGLDVAESLAEEAS